MEDQPNSARAQTYRDTGVALCHICRDREVVASCARCGGALCVQHLPQDDWHRCAHCEEQYHSSQRRSDRAVSIGTVLLTAGAVTTVALSIAAAPVLLLFTGVATTAAGGTVGGIARVVRRRRFLGQRAAPGRELELGQRQVAIAPRAPGEQRGPRRLLGRGRGGHDPPSVPPERRIGYWG